MHYSTAEMMAVAAARVLKNDDVCFVGIGAPSVACNLARLTHAPDITLIYESGTIGTKPDVLPLSIGDPELSETALTTVSVPEMFQYWLQGGRISIGFLGGAQIDRFGNINSSVIGSYEHPKVRLPGGGGAPIHQGVTRADIAQRTGWPIRFADTVDQTPPPTETELAVLRDLHTRTEQAHTGKVMPHAGAE